MLVIKERMAKAFDPPPASVLNEFIRFSLRTQPSPWPAGASYLCLRQVQPALTASPGAGRAAVKNVAAQLAQALGRRSICPNVTLSGEKMYAPPH